MSAITELGHYPDDTNHISTLTKWHAITFSVLPGALPKYNRLSVLPFPYDAGRGMTGGFAPKGCVVALRDRKVSAGVVVDDIGWHWKEEFLYIKKTLVCEFIASEVSFNTTYSRINPWINKLASQNFSYYSCQLTFIVSLSLMSIFI